jgi:NCS2 family nucleobase:cation symporter-2
VLVMSAGAVAVPLILGSVMKLAQDQVALLISADLFCAVGSCSSRRSASGGSASACP